MLKITNYQRNANQIFSEIAPRTIMAIMRKCANGECWKGDSHVLLVEM